MPSKSAAGAKKKPVKALVLKEAAVREAVAKEAAAKEVASKAMVKPARKSAAGKCASRDKESQATMTAAPVSVASSVSVRTGTRLVIATTNKGMLACYCHSLLTTFCRPYCHCRAYVSCR